MLTSRNGLGALRAAAARLNPDLIASGEGGSNLTLVRPGGALGAIVERRELAIHEGRPERRAMALTRTASGVCIANLHATNDVPELAVEDVLRRRRAPPPSSPASAPLLFGGDLNLRPRRQPGGLRAARRALRPRRARPGPTRSTTCSARGLGGRARPARGRRSGAS